MVAAKRAMTARIKSDSRVPYGGSFSLQEPITGQTVSGVTYPAFKANWIRVLKANSIPTGLSLDDDLQTALCAKYPNECSFSDPFAPAHRPPVLCRRHCRHHHDG